jgi:hypothetical protein
MKKFLLSTIAVALLGGLQYVNAQCSVSTPTMTNVTRTPNGNGTCTLKFDLSFTMQNNNGNKTIVIHFWPGNNYPSLCYSGGGCGQPTSDQLAGSYGSIVINNDAVAPSYYVTYPFRTGVTVLATDPSIVRTGGSSSSTPFNFTLKQITIPGVACTGGVIIRGDIWSTNAGSLNSGTNPQCATTGLYLGVGDPAIAGFKNCAVPRMILFGVSTTSATPITVSYKIYRSEGNTTFDPSTDINVTLAGSDPITVSAATSPQSRTVGFTGNSSPGEGSDYWVVVTYTPPGMPSYNVAYLVPNGGCSTLPVELGSFSATRNQSVVNLAWETLTEISNKGFEIQKMEGNGQWQALVFVNSKALDGNSSSSLRYTYSDQNVAKGITQYRIKQVDQDGVSKYSLIRSVRGLGQSGKVILYPNPSANGKMNISFEEMASIKDVNVIDASGRTIRQWKGVAGNSMQVDNLVPGFYSVSVVFRETGVQTVQKFIVSQ